MVDVESEIQTWDLDLQQSTDSCDAFCNEFLLKPGTVETYELDMSDHLDGAQRNCFRPALNRCISRTQTAAEKTRNWQLNSFTAHDHPQSLNNDDDEANDFSPPKKNDRKRVSRQLSSETSDSSDSDWCLPEKVEKKKKAPRGKARKLKKTAKGCDEYQLKRLRNNMAVRKSRDKAKQRQEETLKRVKRLTEENERLQRQVESTKQELSLVRSIFTNLGVPIKQMVTNALQPADK